MSTLVLSVPDGTAPNWGITMAGCLGSSDSLEFCIKFGIVQTKIAWKTQKGMRTISGSGCDQNGKCLFRAVSLKVGR